MPKDSNIEVSGELYIPVDDLDFETETFGGNEEEEERGVLQGENLERLGELDYITPERAKILAAEARAKERPIDYKYIEQMKREGVTEDLAVKAFIGRFGGNKTQTQFFLTSDFYYGSDAPTPLDRLKKAILEDTVPECIEMLEGTKESLHRGNHF